MELKDILCLGVFILLFIINRIYYTKCRYSFFKKAAMGALSVAFLWGASFVLKRIGVALCMNIFTVCFSLLLGIPGVILILLASLL